MSEHIKVENSSELVRDKKSNAIINVNNLSYNNYINAVKKKQKTDDDLRGAIREINVLKNEMTEIKRLLINLTDKK